MSVIVNNISKIYGTQKAVNNISFEVNAGEIVGFLGPNGAGKSTTMKILSCFIPQTSGKAVVCGFDTEKNAMDVKRNVGYLPEHNPLYPEMYVKEYLEFAAGLNGMKKAAARIEEMIEVTGLTVERKKKIGELSKGYRQRVGLAQAMLHDPKVLIMDEPTSGLDPNQLTDVRNLIKKLGKEKTVIISTHIMQEVEAICNRVIIINKGELVANDSVSNIRSQSKGLTIVQVEFKEAADKNLLLQLPGIKNVSGDAQLVIEYTGSDDIREIIFRFAVENKYTLLNLNIEKQSLESVFKEATKKK